MSITPPNQSIHVKTPERPIRETKKRSGTPIPKTVIKEIFDPPLQKPIPRRLPKDFKLKV